MKSDARKELNKVDISVYDKALKQLEDRLREHNLSPNTVRNYLAEIKPFLAWIVKQRDAKPCGEINYDDYRGFLRFLEEDHLKPRTINVKIAAMKQFRQYVQDQDWNPHEIPCRKTDSTLPKVPSEAEALRMLEACRTPEETVLLMLLFSTGVRISEAASLLFSDISRGNSEIHLRPGKGRSERNVPLTGDLVQALEAYCHALKGIHGHMPGHESFVFLMTDGRKQANTNHLRGIFKRVRNAAGLAGSGFTPHSCRHYFALQIYLQKHDLLLVKCLLGHKSLNATEIYLRLSATAVVREEGYLNPLTRLLKGKQEDSHA